MQTKSLSVLAALSAALLLGACGGNSGSGAAKGSISENRTASFKSMMPNFTTMGKMVKGEETYEAEKFKAAAAAFVQESQKPFQYFQNDPNGNGDALPAIWEKPAEYKAVEDKFRAAVENLNAKVQAGNLEEIKAAYGEVGASCKECHQAFRAPK